MTTVRDLVENTRQQLAGSHRTQLNFLAGALNDTATDTSFDDDLRGIGQGAILGVDDELIYVRSASTSNKTASVVRGWLGTDPVPHSVHATVEVSPRFPRAIIKRTLRDEIRSWGTSVFRVDTQDVDVSTCVRDVDLAFLDNDWFAILAVADSTRGLDRRPRFRSVRTSSSHPFGAIILDTVPTAATLTVTVARPFVLSEWDEDTDLVENCGLAETMLDIPPLGALWRLLSPREVTRLDPSAQGEPRSAEEIQGGMIAAVGRGYLALRDQRLADEAYRLRSTWPWRM